MNPIYFEHLPETDGLVFKRYGTWVTQWYYREATDRRFWRICNAAHKPAGELQADVCRAVIDNFGDLVVVS